MDTSGLLAKDIHSFITFTGYMFWCQAFSRLQESRVHTCQTHKKVVQMYNQGRVTGKPLLPDS